MCELEKILFTLLIAKALYCVYRVAYGVCNQNYINKTKR